MSARFKLNFSGLNYYLSSSDDCQYREFITRLLQNNRYASVSMSELETICNMEKKQVMQMVYKMLKQGWLSSIESVEQDQHDSSANNLAHQLAEAAQSSSVLLADMNGLVVAASGYSDVDRHYLAASAINLISVGELAKKRNAELCDDTPWSYRLKWGKLEAMVQLLCIGELKFALVMTGDISLNNKAYFQLITMLLRRYTLV